MDDKETRLIQARQLLKKYQSKHQSNGRTSPVIHLNGIDSSSEQASIPSSRASSACGLPRDGIIVNGDGSQEIAYLKRALEEKDRSYRDVAQKLHTLQTHYAELHTAYSLATQTLQNSTSPEFAEQITKLQTALSVAIEEKTSYQSELRIVKGRVEALEEENKAIVDQIRSSTGSSALHETEKRKLQDEIDRLARNLKQSTGELEKYRRDNLVLESKVRQVNHDRNDTQARLKHIFNEKEALEKVVGTLRHELQMKEIFIKQLTFNDAEKAEHGKDQQEAFTNLTDEKLRLAGEVEILTAKLAEAQRQQQGTRDYYESCIQEINRKAAQVEENVHSLEQEKAELQSNNYELQEKINVLISQQAAASITVAAESVKKSPSASMIATVIPPSVDMVELEALRNSLSAVQGDFARAVDRIHELEVIINDKEAMIETLEQEIAAEKNRLQTLENDLETQRTVQTDVHSLLEQLQNEKATVSRAIAQNIELKDQLGELQDKFVEVTNQSAIREDQRLTALSVVDKLQRKLDEMIQDKNNPNKIERSDSIVQTDEPEIGAPQIQLSHQEQQTDHAVKEEPSQNVHEAPSFDELLHFKAENEKLVKKLEELTGNFNQAVKQHASSKEYYETCIKDLQTQIANAENKTEQAVEAIEELTQPTQSEARQDSHVVFTPQGSPVSTSSSSISAFSAPAMSRDEIIKTLEGKLETLAKEKSDIKVENDRLQYFLTALESENESIGEYIALYQFQRASIQKKVAEKDALINQLLFEKKAAQLQISDLQHVLYDLFGQSPQVLTTNGASTTNNGVSSSSETLNSESQNQVADKLNKLLLEIQHRQHASHISAEANGSPIASTSTATFTDPKLHCPECRGQMFTL